MTTLQMASTRRDKKKHASRFIASVMTPVFMRSARSHTWTLEAHSCTHDSWHDDGIHVTSHAWHHDTLWHIKLDSTTELLPTRFLVGGLTSIMAKAVELITQVTTFLTQNQKVMPGENFRAVVDAQSKNLENGPWNATQKTLLGEAAASAVSVNTDNKPAKRENQQLNNWFAFLTAKDKEFFKSDATLNSKVSHAVDICARLDLYWPSEQTCGHVLSTIKNLVGNNALVDPGVSRQAQPVQADAQGTRQEGGQECHVPPAVP